MFFFLLIAIIIWCLLHRAQTSTGHDECTTMKNEEQTFDQERDTNDADELPKVPYLYLVQYYLLEFVHVKIKFNFLLECTDI